MIDNIKEFLGVKDDYKVPEALLNCLMDSGQQTKLFDQLPEFDKSKDAFYEYFQDEHAQKGALKQEYTPNEIAVLIQRLVGYVSYIEKVGAKQC